MRQHLFPRIIYLVCWRISVNLGLISVNGQDSGYILSMKSTCYSLSLSLSLRAIPKLDMFCNMIGRWLLREYCTDIFVCNQLFDLTFVMLSVAVCIPVHIKDIDLYDPSLSLDFLVVHYRVCRYCNTSIL